jgi:tetratricopeptide (TPR) repeat protein
MADMTRGALRTIPGVSLALLLFAVPAGAVEIGEWVTITRRVDLHPKHGAATRLTMGTCARVLELNGGTAYLSLGKLGYVDRATIVTLQDGLEQFSKLIKDNPKDASAWFARAKIYFHQHELDKAIADCDRGLSVSSTNSEAYTTRGFAWKGKGDNARALADLNRAIELDPANALAWRVRGATWASKADYPKALSDYTESIRVDPENPDSLNHRVVILSACKDDRIRNGKQAVQDGTRACELTDWRIPLFISNLGIAYAEAGNFEAAIEWQTRAAQLWGPDLPASMRTRIEEYRNHQPFRMTWR